MTRRVPWLALALAVAVPLAFLAAPLAVRVASLLPGCPFRTLTGFACLSCGLTRCATALAGGRWAEAWHWHPAAVALLALLPVAVLWDLRRAWRGEPWPGLPEHPAARVLAWSALLGAWAAQVLRGM